MIEPTECLPYTPVLCYNREDLQAAFLRGPAGLSSARASRHLCLLQGHISKKVSQRGLMDNIRGTTIGARNAYEVLLHFIFFCPLNTSVEETVAGFIGLKGLRCVLLILQKINK